MLLETTCFKIDRPNAMAMVRGFTKNGEIRRQSIWLAVRELHFPALLTLQRTATRFKISELGRMMDPDNFTMPLKYAATLVSEYFIKNDMTLWEAICSNGLFDIWDPSAPYNRFDGAESKPTDFRIQLLRIYEIDHEFNLDDIRHATDRVDQLISPTREVGIIAPLISDPEFASLRDLLERSVASYLTRPPRHNVVLSDKSSYEGTYSPTQGDWREIVERQIRERRGQQRFRDALRKAYGDRCLITGCEILAVLEAAHINRYRGEKDNHVENGLLLRADIHTLFDLDLIGIEPSRLSVELHPILAKEYGDLEGNVLACPTGVRPSHGAIELRYKQFQERKDKEH